MAAKEVKTHLKRCPYKIGDTVRFKPCFGVNASAGFGEILAADVTGTVVQISDAHRWYRAAYDTPTGVKYECFKY